MTWLRTALVATILAGPMSPEAGEMILRSGAPIEGELVNDVLALSTGTGVVEVSPGEIASLTREEVRLKDGRLIRGALIGGTLRLATAMGELTIRTEDLWSFRALPAGRGPDSPAPAAAPAPAPSAPVTGSPNALGSGEHDLPSLAAYQGGAGSPAARLGPNVGTEAGRPTLASLDPQKGPGRGEALEVATESAIYRDAYVGAKRVGRVTQGQRVVYLDRIDRRLRVLDRLVFDGGYWVKVRASDGAEGWIPATAVREAP